MHEQLPNTATDLVVPAMSDAKRALLQQYLRGGLALPSPESCVINRRPTDEPAPPSFGQEQLWIHSQLVTDLVIYNEPVTVRRTGPLDVTALKQSLHEIIRRHEAWRTNFAIQDGQLVQVINPSLDLELPLVDLRGLDESEREPEALRLATLDARRPFDLNQGPLLRAMLARITDTDHRLYLTLHQIIFDGVSLYSVFLPELANLYEAFVHGRPPTLPNPPIQYADFAHWQRTQDETVSDELAYWRKQLAGAPAALDVPADRPRPAVQTFRGEQLSFTFPQRLSEALKALSRREGTTLFMTLLAAFQTVLHRYTDQDDLLVGTVTTSRKRSEFDELLGFFLNTLVLRTDLSGDPTFRELLARVRKVTVDALGHGDVPVHRLVKELELERDPGRNPLFQVMFVLEPPLPAPAPGWELSQVDVDAGIARVDLYLELDDRPEGLVGRFRYNSDLFDAASITRMLDHLTTLLEGVSANPECAISDYPLRTETDVARELVRSDSVRPVNPFITFAKSEIEQAIGDRFERQVRQYPGHIAVKSSRHEWSYEELNRRANQLAQTILNLRGAGEERIALLFDHDAPMIAAMLGALKAGKTYVPLDPNNPQERLSQILEHSQATALLTNSRNIALARDLWSAVAERSADPALDRIHETESKAPSPLRSAGALQKCLINIDDENSFEDSVRPPIIEPDRLAYILYTSGSTGQPKGVMQNHRNVLHYIRNYTNNLHLNAGDRLTLLSSYCFDASVMDIYGALLNGATLYPIDIKQEGLDGLSQRLIDEEITVYHSTPTVYRYFVNGVAQTSVCDLPRDNHRLKSMPLSDFPNLRLVVLGGEKVTRTDVELYRKHFSDDCLFVNGLGPTEATVVLQNFINKQTTISGDNMPVGFPVEDTEVLLLNKAGKPSEVSGEIAIKSAHVALGYWRNSEATTNAFVGTLGSSPTVREGVSDGSRGTSPTVREGSIPIYKTGDMGRRLPDGSIQFEGRKDFQVKIRGFRVELGEIESALSQHQLVRESVVVAKENAAGDQRLVAYVVLHKTTPSPLGGGLGWGFSALQALSPNPSPNGRGEEAAELRDFLRQKLPEYMVPRSFVVLDSLPLTASGKLNRRALPASDESIAHAIIAAPRTPLEKSLTSIWADVLQLKAIGIDDNFFDLGGHSLLAVRLFGQIEKKLGKRLPLATLFQAPTVAQLAAVIQKDWTAEWSSLVAINPIQSAGAKPPFFCVHALGGNVLEYRELARQMGDDQAFYGLQSAGLDGKHAPHTRIEDMAAHYIKEMRELQPTGPYFIGGRSLGGMVAFEMSQQLRAQGEEIGLLALLDTYPSGYAKLLRDKKTLRARFGRAADRTRAHLANLRSLSLKDKLLYLVAKSKFAPRKMKSQVWRGAHTSFANLGRPLPRALQDIQELNSLAVREYIPQIYDGHITLFWASSDLRASVDFVEGWRALAGGGIAVHEIPGTHLDIVKEPHVSELASKLRSCLDNSQSKRKS
ncbi:MAG TPA: amino acid adenylation domain-containing protein [Pyrinomonadaceae bacterium]|nr:amino acid adenylation domain-containing protein [Pyrinomonadaceae bacterium]